MGQKSPASSTDRLSELERRIAALEEENARLRHDKAGAVDGPGIDYRRLLEGLPGVAYQFRMDKDGGFHFPYMNERCAELFGHGPEAILADASRVFRLLPQEDADRVNKAIAESAKTLLPYSVEHRVVKPDGETIWVHASSIPRKLPDGDLLWDGFAMDISKRKAAEAALNRSEEKFKLAFQTSPDSINFNRLSDGLYIDINDGFTRIMGYTREEVIGKTSLQLNIWDDPADRERLVAALKEDGHVHNLEARFRAKDGTVRYGLMSARVLQIGGDAVILSITRDITDRKRDEKIIQSRILALTRPDTEVEAIHLTDILDLEMLQKLQDALAEAFSLPFLIYDAQGRLITRPSNPTEFCEQVRSSPEGRRRCERFDARLIAHLRDNPQPLLRKGCALPNIITGTVPILIDGEHVANIGMGQMIDEAFRPADVRQYAEEIGLPPDGLEAAAATLIPYDKERFEKQLAFLNTLAEQLSLLGFQNLQQARFIHERENLTNRLRQVQKMESLGALAGGIAHDFNNILFPIMGYAEMLLDDAPEGSLARKNLEKILNGTSRARELVRQILTFSRQAGEAVQPVRVQLILKEVLKLVRATLPTTIDIRHRIAPDCKAVMADPTHIHQVTLNLITNAYHAMQTAGGTLDIRLETVEKAVPDTTGPDPVSGQFVCLTVADTGHGIPPEIMDKIFDPYFTTKGKDKGTGLGLSVVHGIVKSCGGDIEVTSDPGSGTVFKVLLPVRESEPEAEEKPAAPAIPRGNEHLLIVDDEASVVKMEMAMLERLGYRVTPRTDSMAALEAFETNPAGYDLVITDMTMPRLTGAQLTPRLREIRPDIRVIICTGFSDLIDEEKAGELGIQGFIMKPVVKSEMAVKIREVLDGAENGPLKSAPGPVS
jgi:PAS domain S-box-containing protein